MRISDWSSDVCSSDLVGDMPRDGTPKLPRRDAPRLAIGSGWDDRPIGAAEDGVEMIAEGVELADHLARQMRLGDGAGAQHWPKRVAAGLPRRPFRQAFEHRDRLGDRFDRHPARRLADARPALVEGRSDALSFDQAVLAARD